MLGLDFNYNYDSIGNVLGMVSHGASGTVTQVFTPNDLNLQVERQHGGTVEILGTAATGTVITVNGVRAERQGTSFRSVIPVNSSVSAVETNIEIWAVAYVGSNDVVATVTGKLYVPKADESVAYLANGVIAADSRFAYTFDQDRQLTSVQSTGLSTNIRTELAYDPEGRRVRKMVYRANGGSWTLVWSHEYYYDGWQPVVERISENGTNTIRRYVWAYTGPALQ